MGREEFLARLAQDFPDVVSQINRYESGQLHCEVAVLRCATEEALDAGRLWQAERHFRLVEEMLQCADPELRNALEVSYLLDLALGECTPQRYQGVKERMPMSLRSVVMSHHQNWK